MGYLLNPNTDPRRLATLALTIQTMRVGYNLATRNQLLAQLLDAPTPFFLTPATNAVPVHVLKCFDTATAFIALSGTVVQAGIGQAAASYLDQNHRAINEVIVFQFKQWAETAGVVAWMNTLPVSITKICIAGHSLGGCIGSAMALLLKAAYPGKTFELTTFGTPRYCGRYTTREFGAIRICRVITEGDFLPYLPLQPEDAPQIYAVLNRVQQQSLRSWSHPCAAIKVASNGILSTAEVQRPIAPVTAQTFVGLLNSPDGIFGPSHGIDSYVDFLIAAIPAIIAPPPPPPPLPIPPLPLPPVVNTPVVPLPPAVVATVRNALSVMRRDAEQQETNGIFIPKPSMLISNKNDGVYTLTWRSYTIAVAPTKKKANALKRHFNRFLKIFQTVGQAQSQDFVSALADYLRDAADPTKGYRPTLADGGNPPEQQTP